MEIHFGNGKYTIIGNSGKTLYEGNGNDSDYNRHLSRLGVTPGELLRMSDAEVMALFGGGDKWNQYRNNQMNGAH